MGSVSGAKAGHGHRNDAVAVKSKQVKGANRHQERQRGVKAARDAHHRTRAVRMVEALCEAPSLDGEDVLAARVALGAIGRHKRTSRHKARELGLLARQREADLNVVRFAARTRRVEGGHAHALGDDGGDVDLAGSVAHSKRG